MERLRVCMSGAQAYWRKQRVKEVPSPEHVDAVLSFLAEQGDHSQGSSQGV